MYKKVANPLVLRSPSLSQLPKSTVLSLRIDSPTCQRCFPKSLPSSLLEQPLLKQLQLQQLLPKELLPTVYKLFTTQTLFATVPQLCLRHTPSTTSPLPSQFLRLSLQHSKSDKTLLSQLLQPVVSSILSLSPLEVKLLTSIWTLVHLTCKYNINYLPCNACVCWGSSPSFSFIGISNHSFYSSC